MSDPSNPARECDARGSGASEYIIVHSVRAGHLWDRAGVIMVSRAERGLDPFSDMLYRYSSGIKDSLP
jgi:hypothetical protein